MEMDFKKGANLPSLGHAKLGKQMVGCDPEESFQCGLGGLIEKYERGIQTHHATNLQNPLSLHHRPGKPLSGRQPD